MKKLLAVLAVIIMMVVAVSPLIALAADVTNAEWRSKIVASNNGTAVDDVPGTFILSTEGMIDADMLGANATDATMRTSTGTDVPFMPSANSTFPWCTWVPAIEGSASLYQYLYSGEVTGGLVRYFPDDAGMTTPDSPSMELGGNFTITQRGWWDTDAGRDKNAVYKETAFKTYISGTENITSSIIDAGSSTSLTIRPDANGDYTNITSASNNHWDDVDDVVADGYATEVSTITAAQEKDAYTLQNSSNLTGDYQTITSVVVYWRGKESGGVGKQQPFLRLDGVETEGTNINVTVLDVLYNETLDRPGGGTWSIADIDDLQVAMGLQNNDASSSRLDQVYVTVNYIPEISVTATGVESGEHKVTTTQKPPLHFDGNDDITIGDQDVFSFTDGAGTDEPFSIVFWYNQTNNAAAQYVVTKYGVAMEWMIRLDGGKPRCYFIQTPGNNVYNRIGRGIDTDYSGAWHHFALTYDGTEAEAGIDMYIDGAVADDVSMSAGAYGGFANTNTDVVLGSRRNLSDWLIGDMSEVRIYNRELSATEVLEMSNGIYTDESDLIGHWKLDENTGTTATDSSVSGHDGTITGAGWTGGAALIMLVDDIQRDIIGSANVTDTATDWAFCQNDSIMYLEYQDIEIGGVERQRIEWEYDTTFYDTSGFDNDATPTFRAASAANIAAEVVAHDSLFPTGNPAVTPTEAWEMITDNITPPVGLYTEGGTDFPWSDLIIALAGHMRVPVEVLSIPIAILSAMLAGLIAFGGTHSAKLGVRGSLWVQCMVTGGVMILWYVGGGGVLPGWILIPFGLWAIVMLLWRNPFNPAG